MRHQVFERDSLGCAALFRNLCFSWRWASFVTLCSSHRVLLYVRDSSTEITSRRENTQRDSQYVWICSEEDTHHTHTHTHLCIHTHFSPGRGACLCLLVSHFDSSQPTHPIKHEWSPQLVGVCLLPPEGTLSLARARQPPSPPASAKHSTNQAHMAPFEKSVETVPFKQRKCLGRTIWLTFHWVDAVFKACV